MGFLIILIIAAVVTYIMFNRKPPTMQNKKPSRMDEFMNATADEYRPIPEVFGTCNIKPNLIWMGDFHWHSLRQKTD